MVTAMGNVGDTKRRDGSFRCAPWVVKSGDEENARPEPDFIIALSPQPRQWTDHVHSPVINQRSLETLRYFQSKPQRRQRYQCYGDAFAAGQPFAFAERLQGSADNQGEQHHRRRCNQDDVAQHLGVAQRSEYAVNSDN